MKEIKKRFKLTDFLRELNIGEECKINYKAYKPCVVRSTVVRLNTKGEKRYEFTEKGVIDGCKVTRVK